MSIFQIYIFSKVIITDRTRSMWESCVFTGVCHFVHNWKGGGRIWSGGGQMGVSLFRGGGGAPIFHFRENGRPPPRYGDTVNARILLECILE